MNVGCLFLNADADAGRACELAEPEAWPAVAFVLVDALSTAFALAPRRKRAALFSMV